MKITLDNINQHNLFLIDFLGGNILKGKFKSPAKKGQATTIKFIAKDNEQVKFVELCVCHLFIRRIDKIKLKTKFEDIEIFKNWEAGYINGEKALRMTKFIIFSNEIEAKKILKNVVLPFLIQKTVTNANNTKKLYLAHIERIGALEQTIKSL